MTIGYSLILLMATHYPRPEELLEVLPAKPSDKALHFIAYGIQGLLASATLTAAGRQTCGSVALLVIGLAALAAIDEATQPFFGRYADPLDWLYDCLGLAGGTVVASGAAWWLGRPSGFSKNG